jgi:hypothetical protein
MEPAQASQLQLPYGSPIISFDADLPGSNSTVSSNAVGLSIAHHFGEFRRQRRSPMIAANSAVSAPGAGVSAVSGFRDSHYCCRSCKTLLPATSFYPSSLKRSMFYCKTCCVAKSHANIQKAKESGDRTGASVPAANHRNKRNAAAVSSTVILSTADESLAPGRSNQLALRMLNRLRRMCSRPSKCGFRLVLSNAIALNFDVKVARELLLWWNSTSALGPTTKGDQELRFIPWLHRSTEDQSSPLQPWEVIPVTPMQARRLTSTPIHLWLELLEPSAVTHVTARIGELRRVMLEHDHSTHDQQSM